MFEVLNGAPEVRSAIVNGLPAPEIESMAVGAGMVPLKQRALQLVRDGITTFDEFAKLRL